MYKHAGAVALVFLAGAATVFAAIATSEAVMQKFAEQEKNYALPAGHLAKIARIESNGNATAGSPARAYGLFQWFARDFYDWSGRLYGTPKDPSLRADPYVATEVTAFRQAKARDLMKPYVERVPGAELGVGMYFVHFMGEGGAPKFFQLLATSPQANASQYFPREAASNQSIFNGRTIAGVYNLISQKMQQPGITGVSNYTSTFDGDMSSTRIMDSSGVNGLQRSFTGPIPPPNPNQTYQPNGQPYPGVNVPPIQQQAQHAATGSNANVIFPPASLIIAQPSVVKKGDSIAVSWTSVGMNTMSLCQVFAGETTNIGDGNEGTYYFPTDANTTSTVTFSERCVTREGAVVQKSASVTIR